MFPWTSNTSLNLVGNAESQTPPTLTEPAFYQDSQEIPVHFQVKEELLEAFENLDQQLMKKVVTGSKSSYQHIRESDRAYRSHKELEIE